MPLSRACRAGTIAAQADDRIALRLAEPVRADRAWTVRRLYDASDRYWVAA